MGLKDRFAARQRPQETFPLRMEFGPESEAAEREFNAAVLELASARERGLPDVGALQRRVDAAREKRESFYEFLVVRAMAPAEFEDLVSQHPATEEQHAKAKAEDRPHKPIWNPDTFIPALLAASIDSDMSGEDWAELTSKGPVAAGEVGALFNAALQVNDRTPDPTVGKG